MNRRRFLQFLPVTAGVNSMAPNLLSEEATPNQCLIREVVSGSINGPVARIMEPPQGDPPLPQSPRFKGLRFTGRQRNYQETIHADTWYPSWAQDGTLYSSYTDGAVNDASGKPVRANSQWAQPDGLHENWFRDLGVSAVNSRITSEIDRSTTSGNATLTGDHPFNLTVTPLEPFLRQSQRYEGYYPCADFLYRGM
jgi:hypothetical protein